MSSLAKGDHVEVEFKGKVVDQKSVEEFFRSSFSFEGLGGNWTGIADDETGVIHLFWKYSNPAKLSAPADWPPKPDDVWKIGSYTWHAFTGSKLRVNSGGNEYDADKALSTYGNGRAELLYRKAS